MDPLRRAWAVVPLLLLTTTCREISAPELASLVREAEAPLTVSGELQPAWKLLEQLRLGPWSYVVGPLVADIGGRRHIFTAIAIERTIVRADSSTFTCPRVHRFVTAVEDSTRSLHLGGIDFNMPVAPREECWDGRPFPTSNPVPAHTPFVLLFQRGPFGTGISGSAQIRSLVRAGTPCPFVGWGPERVGSEPPDVACELAEFEVELDAVLAMTVVEQNQSKPAGEVRARVARQTVPGVRIRMYCGANDTYPGCPHSVIPR